MVSMAYGVTPDGDVVFRACVWGPDGFREWSGTTGLPSHSSDRDVRRFHLAMYPDREFMGVEFRACDDLVHDSEFGWLDA